MKLLFDQNISYRICKKINTIYSEVLHVSECGLLNEDDLVIWDYARKHSYTIVTFDADFFEISLILGHPPKIIWIRSGNLTTESISTLLLSKQDVIFTFLNQPDLASSACLELTI